MKILFSICKLLRDIFIAVRQLWHYRTNRTNAFKFSSLSFPRPFHSDSWLIIPFLWCRWMLHVIILYQIAEQMTLREPKFGSVQSARLALALQELTKISEGLALWKYQRGWPCVNRIRTHNLKNILINLRVDHWFEIMNRWRVGTFIRKAGRKIPRGEWRQVWEMPSRQGRLRGIS